MTKSSADLRSPLIARRMERVSSFLAMDVLSAAAAKERRGDTVIHMEVGQPSAPAPRAAREAAKAALDLGRIGYTEALGISALRERIARHYRDTYGVSIAPERVVVTTGSSAGFVLAFLSLFDHGQRGGDHGTGLSGLSQYPGGARHRAGDDPAHQGRRLDHDGRGHRKSPCGEALARHSCHEPRQSHPAP